MTLVTEHRIVGDAFTGYTDEDLARLVASTEALIPDTPAEHLPLMVEARDTLQAEIDRRQSLR